MEDGKDDEEARVKVCIGAPHGNKGKKDWVNHCCTECGCRSRSIHNHPSAQSHSKNCSIVADLTLCDDGRLSMETMVVIFS